MTRDELKQEPLNNATWKAHDKYIEIVGEMKPIVFNNIKIIVAEAIISYIEEVANDTKE